MRFGFHSLALSLNFLRFKMEITILNHKEDQRGIIILVKELISDTTKVI